MSPHTAYDKQAMPQVEGPFFLGKTHDEAIARLDYLVDSGAVCATMSGLAGTGKTTILKAFVRRAKSPLVPVLIDATSRSGGELLQDLLSALSVASHSESRLDRLWLESHDALAGQRLAGLQTLILIDHLDRALPDCLHVIRRLLADSAGIASASFVLAYSGSAVPSAVREWRSWVDVHIDVAPLNAEETAAFVREMLAWLAVPSGTIAPEAVEVLHRQTKGIPRDLLRLCERALLAALHDDEPQVSADVVEAAVRELRQLRPSA